MYKIPRIRDFFILLHAINKIKFLLNFRQAL